jgi:hypothetical protein
VFGKIAWGLKWQKSESVDRELTLGLDDRVQEAYISLPSSDFGAFCGEVTGEASGRDFRLLYRKAQLVLLGRMT